MITVQQRTAQMAFLDTIWEYLRIRSYPRGCLVQLVYFIAYPHLCPCRLTISHRLHILQFVR